MITVATTIQTIINKILGIIDRKYYEPREQETNLALSGPGLSSD